jgi:orotidine-5'-phosphate decarboxylase
VNGIYLDRLGARTRHVGSVLCLGIDPDPARLPPGFGNDPGGIERYCSLLLEAALPYAAAVKPNLAFFEAFGAPGIAALERLRAGIPGDVLLVNVSRGIASAAGAGVGEGSDAGATVGSPSDPFERVAAEAASWARRLAVLP